MRKIITYLIISTLSLNYAIAQFPQNFFNSSNQHLVEQAVENGIVLLQSDYQLLDTTNNTRYGWNNQNVFNSIYSIGVKIENGFLVTDDFTTPWKNDARYNNLSSNSYIPIITNSYNKTLNDSVMCELIYNQNNISCLHESSVYKIDSIEHNNRGFVIDRTNGNKDGWLVWVICSDTIVSNKSNLSVLTYRYKTTIEIDKHIYSLPEPSTSENVICGFYVVPNNDIIGVLDFHLVGFALKDNETWNLVCDNKTSVTSTSDENISIITPILNNNTLPDSINVANDSTTIDETNNKDNKSNRKKRKK